MAEVSRSVSLSSSSNKLPSIIGLTSSTHIYDDVFSSPARRRSSSSSFSPRFEDYSEIFGAASPIASYSTSIPILDLPIADETGNLSGDRSSGNVDYSGIFGGYRGDDSDVVSYEELVNQSTKRRSPAQSLTSRKESDGNSQNIQPSSNGSSCQSISNVKHVNIAYNKTSQMSKDGVNGTIHIAHLNAVPGFTYSFDEVGPPGKTRNNATTPVMMNDAKPSGYFNADKNQGNHYRKTRSDLGAKQAGQPAAGSHYRKTSYDLGANKQAGEHDAVSHYRKASFDFGANKQAGKHGARSGLSGSYPFDASRNTGENNVKAKPSKMLPPLSPKVVATNGTDDSKDGGNGTVHAAHFNAVPGFDFSFDDVGPPGKTGSSATTPAVNDAKSSKQGKHSRKSSSDLGASKQAGERGDRSGVSGSHPTDSSCNASGTNMKAKLSKMVPPATPSTVASNVSDDSMPMKSFPGVSKNNLYKGAGGDTSPPLLDEQLDVNSVAAASAAALKRAIEEAETQIRLANELLERKGGQGSSKLTFKDILKSKAPKKKAYVNGTYVAEDKKLHQSSPQVDSSKQSSTVLKWLDASETTQVIPLIENRTIICSDAEPREETTANESKTSQECYKREGGGEWEATKHFSYFINGVKNKIASFMTKQVDSEQKVEQKETTMVSEPVAQSQEGGSGIEVEDLDVEQETDTKHGATMSYKEHELDVDKSCMVPEVIESEENELHSGAHLEHVNGGELRGSADLVQGKIHEEVSVDAQEHMEEQIDFPESKEEEKKVEVLETGEHEVGNRQEVVIDDVEDLIEEAGEPDELGLDNFCVRQGLQMGLVDADKQEDNDKSLEEPCYMIAHEEKVPSNGEETSKMLDLSPVQEMASTEKIIGDYHDTENSVDELKEDSYLEAREMLEESDIQQESEEIPKEASPMEEIGISAEGKEEVHRWEEDMKIQKQNSETGETAVPLQATVEAVECDRYVLASDSVCKQAEDTFLDRSSACSDDGCEASVGGDASFVSIDDPTKPAVVEAANELIEEEMVQPSIPVEGDAGLRRNGHMTINSPSETVDNVEEPVLREVANELEAEETVQSSVSDEDNAGFVGIGKEINDTESGIPSGEVLLSQHGTDVNFEQENADKASEQGECLGSEIDEPEDSDRKPEESKFEGSLVNEPESLLRDSAQIENARAEDMACDQEGLKENIESIHQEGQKQNVESVHRRRRWFENTEKVVAPERPSIMEEDGIAVEPNHDNAEGPESGGSVEIHAGKMVSDSEEGETVREADVITEQRRPNLEATPKRRRWFVNREEVGVTQRPSLFGGDEVSGEINHESEKESKLDNSLENCVDKLVGGSGEASDMGRADVGVNADRDIPSVEATPRRKRWFENGEKVVAARRLNILASDGATLETERGSKTEENIVKQEHIDRTPMISKGVDKNNHVEQGNQLQGDADEVIRRGREKEKEKLAVERAIREARERAFTEARERAKRDAMERPTAGASQRAGVAPQDRPGKAFGESKSFPDKESMDAKLRAERAAVERATAEARERALQKALSEKAAHKSREQLQDPRQQNSAGNCSSRFSESSNSDNAASGESAQRHKAILERHGRTMERAAKALEEKNMRDLLVQKEQAERNRLANALDAEVKRWSSGKEGNLRALLSTLQYILGSDSGWQPISLTDLVAVASVRKAYKKATLCVHPDKLQQRGANIQQKYICEKVFDLLKDAWGKFNRDERW